MDTALRDYAILTRIQLLELRTWGPITALVTTVFPILMIFGFGIIGGGVSRGGLIYVVTGAAVMSLVTIGITSTSQDLGNMRSTRVLQYYASLPISKGALLAAILTVRALITLPGLALTLVLGSWFYRLPVSVNIAVVALLPLTILALSGIGAAIGILITDFRVVALLSQLAFVVVMFASPVLIPEQKLPGVLQPFAYLLPPTYAADAFRRALTGTLDARLLVDFGVLAACALASLVGVSRGLPWHLD
jgi:ABC-2 type transport system permease protein